MAVDTADLLPGRYRGPQRIGRGGMGEIYRATDTTLGRAVAVKVLSSRYSEDQGVRQRFTREALAAARLSGTPNVITIFDVGEHNDRPYIVMEYLSGGSLEDRLKQSGAQPPEAILGWLEQAARALDAAHAAGVVHRDVKPANLLLDRNGDLQVADFGVASAAGLDSMTATGTILGTAGYLSPEQAQGERATPASDRYALGVLAFELLTGHRPFEAESFTAEAAAHVTAPVPSVCDRMAELPCELDPVFERGLAKDPTARYPSAAEFVAALRHALDEAAGQTAIVPPPAAVEPPPALPPPPAPRPPAPVRRFPAWLIGLGLLLLAGAGGAVAAVLLAGGDDPPEATRAAPPQPQIVTQERTVTQQGRVTTREVTVTTTPPAATTTAGGGSGGGGVAPSGSSGESLNDQGYTLMRAGDYGGALPLLEESVRKLSGSGKTYEAYASYNLAYTRYQLGRCDGVPELLDRSAAIQGERAEIARLHRDAERRCS